MGIREASPDENEDESDQETDCVIMPWMIEVVEQDLEQKLKVQVAEEKIEDVLRAYNGDVNAAIDHLLRVLESENEESRPEAEANHKEEFEDPVTMEDQAMSENQQRNQWGQDRRYLEMMESLYQPNPLPSAFPQAAMANYRQEAQCSLHERPPIAPMQSAPVAPMNIAPVAPMAPVAYMAPKVQQRPAPTQGSVPNEVIDLTRDDQDIIQCRKIPISSLLCSDDSSSSSGSDSDYSEHCLNKARPSSASSTTSVASSTMDQHTKRQKSPDGTPVRIEDSRSFNDDDFEPRRRKVPSPPPATTVSPQPTRRSSRIMAKAAISNNAPPPPPSLQPKSRAAPKPRAPPKPKAPKKQAVPKNTAAKRKPGRKKAVQNVTMGIRELFV